MELHEVVEQRDLKNVAIVGAGADGDDVGTVLRAIHGGISSGGRATQAYRRHILRPARAVDRRVRGRSAPPASRDRALRQIVVLAPEVRPDWHLGRRGARHVEAKSLVDINWQLKRLGPFDAIFDLSVDPELPHDRTWSMLFLHLRDQGVYVSVDRGANPLIKKLADVVQGRGESWAKSAVESVTFHGPVLVVEKTGTHLLKLRDHEVDRFLPSRDESGTSRVLQRLPAVELASRTQLVLHSSDAEPAGFETVMSVPEMRMRHYSGKIGMATHSLLFTEHTFLPETYRHHLEKRLAHTRIEDCNAQFGTIADEHRPTVTLDGDYFDLDSPFPGHFGHVTTEVLSRLWGWDEAKRQFPELKAIWRIRYPNDRDPNWERDLFRAYGIADDDMVVIDRPVWLNSVIGVTPMWHNQIPHYVHPKMGEAWKRIGDNLTSKQAGSSSRIFVSRKPGLMRSCRNGAEVEDLFRGYGFDIVYPETLSLVDQAATFQGASVVAGYGGSAMFNVMFSERLSNLIVLAHEAYTARNEYMFSSILGGRTDYFWSAPEVAHPEGGWTQEAFTSDWSFDFKRNGRELNELLNSLA